MCIESDDNTESREHIQSYVCDEESNKREFFAYYHESKLPHPNQWPEQSPVFVTASKRAPEIQYRLQSEKLQVGHNTNEPATPIPLDGSVVLFNGPIFRGKIVSRMRDVPLVMYQGQSPPSCSNEDYFKGRSRQFQWTVQGTFTKRCRFDDIVTGQMFDRPFRSTPSSAIVKKCLNLLEHRLPDTFECDFFSNQPRFEHPLICGCQYFRVDKRSSYEDTRVDRILGEGERGDVIEDCSLLGNEIPTCPEKRRKFFCKAENLEKYYFEPNDYVYTFDFYANFFSPARHRLEITPFFSFDLTSYFNGQPLFMAMAKEKISGKLIWATELWHAQLLDYEKKESLLKRLFKSSKKQSKQEEAHR